MICLIELVKDVLFYCNCPNVLFVLTCSGLCCSLMQRTFGFLQTVKVQFNILMDANYYVQVPLAETNHCASLNGSNDHLQRQWRNVVLEHMHQLLSGDEGGIQRCIRDALLFHPENGCNMTAKVCAVIQTL